MANWFYFIYMAFFCYTTAMVARKPEVVNIIGCLTINLPFITYVFVKTINYEEKLELLFNLNYFFLCIVVFFGIYEYLFAQDFLRLYCIEVSGRAEELDFPHTFFYRSISFVMNFVHFSYYGLLCYFIAFAKTLQKPNIFKFVFLILSFLGLVSSVGFSAIAIAVSFTVLYMTIFGKWRQKAGIILVIISVFLIMNYLYANFKESFGFFQRIDLLFTQKDSGHRFLFLNDFLRELKFFGTGSFEMSFEQEYFDAWQRFGVPMGTIYLCLTFTIYYRALKMAIRFNEMRIYTIPLLLYCIAYLIIGFVHHTIDNSNQIILVFAFIAMVENRYKVKMKAIVSRENAMKTTSISKGYRIGFAEI